MSRPLRGVACVADRTALQSNGNFALVGGDDSVVVVRATGWLESPTWPPPSSSGRTPSPTRSCSARRSLPPASGTATTRCSGVR